MTGSFDKVLIANRGEIALRIQHSLRAMGLRSVAIYSQADADALHVREADEAVCIGGAAASASYLHVDRVLDAAERTGAGAVHPGYGFLAESAAFAEACAVRGLVFIGPAPDVMRDMADKARAKTIMERAGVPCVPGYDGADQSPERLLDAACELGFPIMIKARAGGGGRGMRLVSGAAEFPTALASAVSEANAAFGDGAVLLERAIVDPRHVEIQILADAHGNVVHLGERDCSIQRRHQKLVEEAPSPAVNADLRGRLGGMAVDAAKAIGYVGAGTFEFLLDGDGTVFFIEMNTRLQVEHGVTEALTGLDLVEVQIRLAMGGPLPIAQRDVHLKGHAIEVRLCAEDPSNDFTPQSGRVTRWQPPTGLRADHALCDGAVVPPHYDSMIAKVIAHGATRDDARRKLIAGLARTELDGLRTNRDYLLACLTHADFARGAATTGFIAQFGPDILTGLQADEARAAMRAGALMRAQPGVRLTHGFPAPLRLARDERLYAPVVRAGRKDACRVEMDGDTLALSVLAAQGGELEIEEDGRRYTAHLACDGDWITLHALGRCFDFRDRTFAPVAPADAAEAETTLRASMTGRVVTVDVATGDTVKAGQPLIVLEAMKMEQAHCAPVAGRVDAVHVSPGDQVNAGAVLVELAKASAKL